MVRRAVVDDRAASEYSESRVVEHRSVASIVATVVTVLFVTVIGLIGLHTLLEAMDARESNGLVNAVETLASPFLAPFSGVFNDQSFWATALIAAVTYTVVYLIAMAILRRDRTI